VVSSGCIGCGCMLQIGRVAGRAWVRAFAEWVWFITPGKTIQGGLHCTARFGRDDGVCCEGREKKQIPGGNDRKKSKSNCRCKNNCNGNCNCKNNGNGKNNCNCNCKRRNRFPEGMTERNATATARADAVAACRRGCLFRSSPSWPSGGCGGRLRRRWRRSCCPGGRRRGLRSLRC
jgi:hypothetical protein